MHLDFLTAINVHKNILAVNPTSVVKLYSEDGLRQNRRNPGAESYAATPLSHASTTLSALSNLALTGIVSYSPIKNEM